MMTPRVAVAAFLLTVLAACSNEPPAATGPAYYQWPDSFAFLIEFVSESRSDTVLLVRYEERKALRFVARGDRFLVWHDSVVKESLMPGRAALVEPFAPEDTLQYYAAMDRRGRISGSEPGCDPAAPACREALPSTLPLEVRRLVPALPEPPPRRGQTWEDTVVFDDTPRPRGVRGSVVTSYRVMGDTVVAGDTLWVIAWRSVRRTFGGAGGLAGLTPNQPVEEVGMGFSERRTGLPVYATWAGGVVAPPGVRAATGVSGTGFRGRAYLAGSVVERVLSPASPE